MGIENQSQKRADLTNVSRIFFEKNREVDFSQRLPQLQIPVSFFVGRNKEADIPSDISKETLFLYTQSLPSCEIVEFLQSGHMIPDEEQQKYITEVGLFINKIGIVE